MEDLRSLGRASPVTARRTQNPSSNGDRTKILQLIPSVSGDDRRDHSHRQTSVFAIFATVAKDSAGQAIAAGEGGPASGRPWSPVHCLAIVLETNVPEMNAVSPVQGPASARTYDRQAAGSPDLADRQLPGPRARVVLLLAGYGLLPVAGRLPRRPPEIPTVATSGRRSCSSGHDRACRSASSEPHRARHRDSRDNSRPTHPDRHLNWRCASGQTAEPAAQAPVVSADSVATPTPVAQLVPQIPSNPTPSPEASTGRRST